MDVTLSNGKAKKPQHGQNPQEKASVAKRYAPKKQGKFRRRAQRQGRILSKVTTDEILWVHQATGKCDLCEDLHTPIAFVIFDCGDGEETYATMCKACFEEGQIPLVLIWQSA